MKRLKRRCFFFARGRNLYMISRQIEVLKSSQCSMHVVLIFVHRGVCWLIKLFLMIVWGLFRALMRVFKSKVLEWWIVNRGYILLLGGGWCVDRYCLYSAFPYQILCLVDILVTAMFLLFDIVVWVWLVNWIQNLNKYLGTSCIKVTILISYEMMIWCGR